MEENYQQGPLEKLNQDSGLNMLEAALPYLGRQMQRPLAFYIKFAELNRVMEGFEDEETLSACGLNEQGTNLDLMFQAMRMAASREQAARIDQIMNLMQMSKMLPGLLSAMNTPQPQNFSPSQNTYGQEYKNSSQTADMVSTLSAMMRSKERKEDKPNMMNLNWMNDPRIQSISPEKLNILKEFIGQNHDKSPEALIPQIVTLNTQMRAKGLTFEKPEMTLILDILKENMSFEERQRIDIILNVMGN